MTVPLRGVGRNLQDHISAGVAYAPAASRGRCTRAMRLDRIAVELAKAYFFGKGIATDLPGGRDGVPQDAGRCAACPTSSSSSNAAPMTAAPYLPPFSPPFADGFACRAVLLRPESRGAIALASADPRARRAHPPEFPRHGQGLAAAARRRAHGARDRTAGAAARLRRARGAPGPAASSDAEIDAHIRATGITVHHPLGTCKMGPDADATAVVDAELRVRGVEGLRVVDASVMPDLVGGNINAPVIMIAEKAADLIRGRTPLAPVNV